MIKLSLVTFNKIFLLGVNENWKKLKLVYKIKIKNNIFDLI